MGSRKCRRVDGPVWCCLPSGSDNQWCEAVRIPSTHFDADGDCWSQLRYSVGKSGTTFGCVAKEEAQQQGDGHRRRRAESGSEYTEST